MIRQLLDDDTIMTTSVLVVEVRTLDGQLVLSRPPAPAEAALAAAAGAGPMKSTQGGRSKMLIEIHLPDDWTAVADPAGLRTEIDSAMSALGQARLRLTTLIDTPAAVEQISATYLDARDGTVPEVEVGADISAWPAWVQPLGAGLGAYRAGDVRQHNGKLWRSAVDNNVWEPGVNQWVDITAELSPPAAAPASWSPDVGYEAGKEVAYGGHVYRCKVAHIAGQYGAMTPDNPVLWAVWELVA